MTGGAKRCVALRKVIITVMAGVALSGCDGSDIEKKANYLHEVEIAPGKWLTLKEERGKCWFICEWKGRRVIWLGKRDATDENELPVTLREFDGDLYLIVFNREKPGEGKYVYLKLQGTQFEEITPGDFPKSIATENILGRRWASLHREGIGTERVDTWDLLRKLDAEHPYFTFTHTGKIWIQLKTGKGYEEISRIGDMELKDRMVREYSKEYKPIPLPTLTK
jgi:hypothetical protein